jgi:hypothetical protein
MPRSLLLASALVAFAGLLGGCDAYGLDPEITDPTVPPVEPPPPTNGIDTAALAAALGCDAVGLAQMGGATGGSLSDTDCVLALGRFPLYDGDEFLDGFAFRLDDATAVRLDLEAGGFDPVLILLDAEMNLVAFNDDRDPGDPAANENARIDTTLAAGTYVAIATSFFDGQRGTYALTMSEQ